MDIDDQVKPPVDGELFVRAFGRDGRPMSAADTMRVFADPAEAWAVAGGLAVPDDVPVGYVPIGANLAVDLARQTIANLIGGRDFDPVTPSKKWIVTQFSVGTYDTVPRFSDVTLSPQPDAGAGLVGGENEIQISTGVYKKLIGSVDWPQPFIVRFELVLETNEAVGYTIRELGLWTDGAGTPALFARKITPGVVKTGDYGLSWLWRIRC
jgi:hypothetical protein